MRARVLGRLRPDQAEEARAWCAAQPLAPVTGSSYVRGRLEQCWPSTPAPSRGSIGV